MKRITNLSELLAYDLKKLYFAEQQQTSALSLLTGKINSPELKKKLQSYSKLKEENLNRLKKSFQEIDIAPVAEKCEIMQSLIDSCQAVASHTSKNVADAELIGLIQQINHYNIAAYGTTASYSRTIGKNDIATQLHDSLEKEKETDSQLSLIAEKTINPAAILA